MRRGFRPASTEAAGCACSVSRAQSDCPLARGCLRKGKKGRRTPDDRHRRPWAQLEPTLAE